MKELLRKLNYKEQRRIVVVNSEQAFYDALVKELPGVITDNQIDQRCPYTFMLVFVRNISEVEHYAPIALHNLTADGNLWFCFPRKTSKTFTTDLEKEKGWDTLIDSGFHQVRMITVDNDWSALKFRNNKFLKQANTSPDR